MDSSVLRSFIAKVKESERRLSEGQDDYSLEFLKIRIDSDDLRELDEFKSVVGARPENFRKNRYRDILPFDYSRVTIDTKPARCDSGDYINASFINGANGKVAYIATQGPLKETLADFWQLIYQYEVSVIVMLCDLVESGKPKCEKYWPDGGSKMKYGDLRISLVSEVRERDHYVVRTFRLKRKGGGGGAEKERIIFQLQYFGWPDHGTPDEIAPLLEFVDRLRDYQPQTQLAPIVVHCSAGCGRTGTICAIDYVRTLIHSKRVPDDFNVSNLVAELRKQRPAMVQSKEQYVLVHRAVAAIFEQELARTSSLSAAGTTAPADPLQINVSELFISSPPLTPAPPIPPGGGENSCNNSHPQQQQQARLPVAPSASLSPSVSSAGRTSASSSDDTNSSCAGNSNAIEQRSPVKANQSAQGSPACRCASKNDNSSHTSYETLDEEGECATSGNNQAWLSSGAEFLNGREKRDASRRSATDLDDLTALLRPANSPILASPASPNHSSHDSITASQEKSGCEYGLPDFPEKFPSRLSGAKPSPSSWSADQQDDEVISSFQRL